VSARAENGLLVFDTRQLLPGGDTALARVARVPVGTAPVGVVVTPDGRRVLVTNSNRFAGDANDRQSITIIDATRVADGAAAIIGQIPAGAFPRELRLMPDGRTLVLTNFNSQTVQLVDLTRFGLAK
jgi:DNA-binding beta-propeller fold protein YncE